MTKYFLRDTPLAGLERQMMTPPHFSPRGGGQMILCRFRYRPEDVACKHCTKYRRKQCTMPVCPWIEERAEAGAVTYSSLAADYYRNWQSGRLGERIEELLSHKKAVAYYDAAHTSRFLFYYPYLLRHHGDDTGRRRLATMYLLTATESLCRAVPNIFGLWSIRLSGWDTVRAMSEQEYVLYQAAKGLYQNHQYISFQELCDRELVDDTALTLILDAMLIAHYGKAMFTIGGTGGEV